MCYSIESDLIQTHALIFGHLHESLRLQFLRKFADTTFDRNTFEEIIGGLCIGTTCS